MKKYIKSYTGKLFRKIFYIEYKKIKEEVNIYFKTPEGKNVVENFVTGKVSYLDAVTKCTNKLFENHQFISDQAATRFRWDCDDEVGKHLREEYKKQTGIDLDDMTNLFKGINMINIACFDTKNVTTMDGIFDGISKA